MTAPFCLIRTEHDLLDDYDRHVAGLAIGDGSRAARRRSARTFVRLHPDLAVWLVRPTPARSPTCY